MKNITEGQLNNIKVPNIEVDIYKSQLESALMNSTHWNKKRSLFTITNFNMKSIALLGISLVVIVTGFIGGSKVVSRITGSTQRVYAQEVAKNSYEKISDLPLEKQEWFRVMLSEAQNAQDLILLDYNQFAVKYPNFVPSATGLTHEQELYNNGRFLEYTNPRGERVIVGVNTNDLPFLNLLPNKTNDDLSPEEKLEVQRKEEMYKQ